MTAVERPAERREAAAAGTDLLARAASSKLTQQAFGYWQSGALFELLSSGLADHLDGNSSGEELALECGLNPDGTLALLRAAQAMGVAAPAGTGWTLTPATKPFLDPGSPTSLRHWFAVMDRWRKPWSSLSTTLQSTEGGGGSARLEGDPAYVRDFIIGMHEFARLSSKAVIDAGRDAFPAPGARDTLLDVGGGAGTYAIAALLAAPDATGTVLDHPDVIPLCAEIARQEGVADRLSEAAGDYRGSYGDQRYGTVLLSNVLHQEDDDNAVAMLRESRRVTRPGGHVVVHTHLSGEQRPKLFPALQGVSAFVLWSGGAGMTEARLHRLLHAAELQAARISTVRDSGTTLAVCPV
ncbi:hypothetical protein FRP1_16725 [Pseudonocardia sp. EC080625-04]|uniref:methyltransferase n=1 Tax=Pseudonocardia sp. EC080625-04 TaxID=1096868 RepID=UPI0006CB7127|nr:methyltransferase [Pseudonocardia sp. EC080625-04]ALE74234.1 hypothetical protein FRP1_16725 [Pseudonocardia sp. EC080625-04]